mgnify:CR=1 FL=1
MGLRDIIDRITGGGSSRDSSPSSGSRDRDSIQSQINAEQARIGQGQWNEKLNDLVRQRDNPSRGGGIAAIGNAIRNAGSNVARDVGMAFNSDSRDADYYRRTANTIARTQGADAAKRYIRQMNEQGGTAATGVGRADVAGSVSYGQRTGMLNALGDSSSNGSGSAANTVAPATEDMADQYAENLRRYNEYMQGQNALTVAPQQPAVTPEMRQAALQTFESQRGAGQMPYYMAAAAQSQDPDMSPAFQYAAQNYATLGGSQRLGPRPMEMMSVAERRQINDMAQAMADQAAQQQAAQNQYQQGMDMVMRGGGKGGGATMPQGKPMMPTNMPPDYYGGMPRPPLPFASMLAQRFGGFGGQ